MSFLYPSELTGVFIHRGLENPDKDREASCFSPQKPSGGSIECPAGQFLIMRIAVSTKAMS